MILKDISFSEPEKNIFYDDVLLALAETEGGDDVLRFWESQKTFIVLGRIGKAEEDLKKEAILKDRVPVLRRSSGGGTVVQGQGCLNYTLVMSKERNTSLNGIHSSYEYILSKIVTALRGLNVVAEYLPISDIALSGSLKKFSGNAQKRSRKYILHHGTILYDFELSKIDRYLKIPQSMPDYRKKRGHLDFVCNINASAQNIKLAIQENFGISRISAQPTAEEKALLQKSISTKEVFVVL